MALGSWTSHIPTWAKVPVRWLRSVEERQDWSHEMRRRRAGEPALPGGRIERIVVICHGNICRSPFAGRDLATRLPDCEVRTAGLEADDGKPPEPFARIVAEDMGVSLDGHGARRFDEHDVEWADLILAMQGRHLAKLEARWSGASANARLLGDYLDEAPHVIEDPWGSERAVFESVFAQIGRANQRLAELVLDRAAGDESMDHGH